MGDARPASIATVLRALFGFRGRLGRVPYVLGLLLGGLALGCVISMALQAKEGTDAYWMLGLAFIATSIAFAWSVVALSVKRLRDIGLPAALALVVLFPAVAWIGILFLAFAPGQPTTSDDPSGPPQRM